MKQTLLAIIATIILASCGSSKALQGEKTDTTTQGKTSQAGQKSIDFLRQITDNAIYNKNIVSPIDFSLTAKGRNINVSGKLQMRKDELIRITLTPLGLMEAGRIEFAPEYVLVVDRINKQYIKATYKDIDFLQNNGLDFYTLQALFWNELFIPYKNTLADADLSAYNVDMQAQQERPVTLRNGSLDFRWTADVERKQLKKAEITYSKGTAKESTATFNYSTFVPVGTKKFPSKQTLTFNSNAAGTGEIILDMELNRITNDDKWDTKTTLSARYTQVTAQDVLSKLLGN